MRQETRDSRQELENICMASVMTRNSCFMTLRLKGAA